MNVQPKALKVLRPGHLLFIQGGSLRAEMNEFTIGRYAQRMNFISPILLRKEEMGDPLSYILNKGIENALAGLI